MSTTTADAITPGETDTTPAAPAPAHNASAQHGVTMNPDPVLDVANEHAHAHLHHGTTAPAKDDDLVYAKGDVNYNGSKEVRTASSSTGDEESGGVGDIRDVDDDEDAGKKGWKGWTFRRVYRQYKLVFHLAIWAVWTA